MHIYRWGEVDGIYEGVTAMSVTTSINQGGN